LALWGKVGLRRLEALPVALLLPLPHRQELNMATNIWQDNTKTVPKSSTEILRVDMHHSEIGARASHLPKGAGKNTNSIKHVK
jgi:hypothetical protein